MFIVRGWNDYERGKRKSTMRQKRKRSGHFKSSENYSIIKTREDSSREKSVPAVKSLGEIKARMRTCS